MKRVLVDVGYLNTAIGGIGTYINQILGEIESQGEKKFKYIITPSKNKVSRSIYLNEKPDRIKSVLHHLEYFLRKQFVLPVLCLYYKVDLLLVPDYVAPFFCFRTKKVIVLHDAFFWKFPNNYNPLWRRYFVQMIKLGLRGKAGAITTSEYTKNDLGNFLPIKTILKVVYQSPKLLPKNEHKVELLEMQLNRKEYILHVGTFDPRKNLPLLIASFNDLVKSDSKFENIKLVLAGATAESLNQNVILEIRRLILEFGIYESVFITGFVNDSTLASLYRNALIYVFPSVDEGFGIPIVESFSADLPVLVSDKGALKEIGGDAVLVFNSSDRLDLKLKMERLCQDVSLRNLLIHNGRMRLKKFTRDNFFKDLEDAIEEISLELKK